MDVVVYGKNYFIEDELADYLKTYDIEINESYYDYLNQFKNPYHSLDEDFIQYVKCDVLTKHIIKKHGDIVCLNGNVINKYDNFVEALLNNFTVKSKYIFFNLMDNIFSDYNFFGVKVEIINERLTQRLNRLAQQVIQNNNEAKTKKYYSDDYHKGKLGNMSYDDFVLQRRKNQAFLMGLYMSNNEEHVFPKDRSNINKEDYDSILNSVLERYSYDGKTAFSKVRNLNDCKEYSGIYLLCLKKELGFYVGQTTISFKKRILQHLRGVETYFDCNHCAPDITDIYIMHINGRFIDDIESDLIAFIPQNYSLNITAGGLHNNQFVYVDSYVPKKYLLKEKQIEFRTKESLRIRKREENFHNLFKEYDVCEKAVTKFLSMNDYEKTYDICLKAVKYKGSLIEKVPKYYRDEKLCYVAFHSFELIDADFIISNIPEEVLTHDFALKIVSEIHSVYYSLPRHLQTKEIQVATGYKRFKKVD